MAGSKIGALHISLGLNSAQFQTGLKKAEGGMARFGKVAKVALLAVAAAATTAAVALGVAVKRTIDYADSALDAAEKIGIQVEELQRLRYAAELAGVGQNTLDMAMQRFSRRVGEAVKGGGELKGVLDQYNIAVVDGAGNTRPLVDVLGDLSDVIAGAESSQEQLRIAFKAFDSEGAALVNVMREGSAALDEYMAAADRTGGVISGRAARAASEFNDSLTNLNWVMQGVSVSIMEAVLPSLREFGALLSSPDFANSARDIGVAIVDGMKLAVDAINTVMGALRGLRDAMSWMSSHDIFGNEMPTSKLAWAKGRFNAKKTLAAELAAGNNFDPSSFLSGFGGTDITVRGGATAAGPFTPAVAGAKALKKEIEITIPKVTEMQQAFTDLGTTVDSSLSGAFSGMTKAIIKGEDAIGSLIGSVGQLGDRLIDMAFDQAIQGLFGSIMGIFGGGMGLGGGGFGRATYGGGGGFFPAFPGFANGTMSAPGGMAWVGERGPELVRLPRGSQVIPNDAISGMGGGLTVNVDARGAQMGVAEQLDEWARYRLPALVRHHAGTTMPENG